MKKYIPFLFTFFFGMSGYSTIKAQEKNDSVAVIATALNYAEGFYSGNAERMEKALHPDLNKVVVTILPKTTAKVLQYSTFSQLIELSRSKGGFIDEDRRDIQITVLDVNGNLASARLTSAKFDDYLQMVNIEGMWKIVNVLWVYGPDTPSKANYEGFHPDSEREVVKKTVSDYYQSGFTADTGLFGRVVHPELRVAQLVKMQQTGKIFISRSGVELLKEVIHSKLRQVPEDQRNVDIQVLDIMENMAFVRAVSINSTGYFQLGLIDGNWKIINVINRPKPEASKQK